MMAAVLWMLAGYALTFAILEWLPLAALRPLEGWLIPHRTKQATCRVQCGTCKEKT
jgi:hypothetical protein